MNEQDIEKKIVGLLNSSLDRLNANQLARLHSARELALSKLDPPHVVAGLAAADGVGNHTIFGSFSNFRLWRPTLMLVVVLAAVAGWYSLQESNDSLTDDVELLEDELPVHAYLDREFDTWLNRSSR